MMLKSVDTLLDVLHFADSHTAVVVPELGINVTYESLRQQVLAMANALASAGIRRGDAVAIALPNGLPAIVSFLAASIAGTAAPLNPAYPYEEFHFFLGDTNARILLCPPVGAEFVRLRPVRAGRGGDGDDGPVRVGEENFDRDFDGFPGAAVIQSGLLRVVVTYKRV